MLKKKKINPYTEATKWVLKTVVKERKFFEANPPALAYIMGFQDEMHYASRHDPDENLHDGENPKYPIMELEEKVGKDYANLIYDAWAASHDEEESIEGTEVPDAGKMNKTADEWVAIKMHPHYRYSEMYPTRLRALCQMLCTIGNGMDWNKDGYLTYTGPSGVDSTVFFGFRKALKKLPKDLQEKIKGFRENSQIKESLKKYHQVILDSKSEREHLRKFADEHTSEETKAKRKKDLIESNFYPMSTKYSGLTTMPNNVHLSYVYAAIEICQEILDNPEKEKENLAIARKFLPRFQAKIKSQNS